MPGAEPVAARAPAESGLGASAGPAPAPVRVASAQARAAQGADPASVLVPAQVRAPETVPDQVMAPALASSVPGSHPSLGRPSAP